MIVSIHVTKTAGTSFGAALKREFGARFMHDDEDWAGYRSPAADARRAANAARMRARRDELLAKFDVIHGHFVPEKFAGLFPSTDFVAFFRDPFQQAVSHYEFLRRVPEIDHPVVQEFRAVGMTLQDFIAWDAVGNPQTQMIGGFSPEDFTMIGLTEEFARSIALFNTMFGRDLTADVSQNANPSRDGSGYLIDADLRDLIARHRAQDIDLYRRAQARFTRLTSVRSVFRVGGTAQFGVLDVPIDRRKAALVSAAIERYALRTILDVGACWGVHGGYTFHALKSGKITRAVIVDGDVTMLTRERAAVDPRVEIREGDLGDAGFIDALPRCDAAIIFDVLLHQVAPDWDAFLARYARKVDHFIIWNQDWIGSEETVRFVQRGLDWYLANVGDPNPARIIEWFARHDEISPQFGRPWRDIHFFWQWGIVNTELIAAMRKLGFALDHFDNFGTWSDRHANIENHAYLFSRR
jgi:hypothetical protein